VYVIGFLPGETNAVALAKALENNSTLTFLNLIGNKN